MTSDVTQFVDNLSAALHEGKELRKLLRQAWKHELGPEIPVVTMRRLLREREVLIDLLKKSGAVEQVGASDIGAHLDWLIPKFLKPVRWPGRKETA